MTFLPFTSYEAVRPDAADIVPFIGERAALLFAHSVAVGSGSPVATEFYRRALVARDENADDPQVTEAEQLLIDWGRLIGSDPAGITPDFSARLVASFSAPLRLALLTFASSVVASGVVATVGGLTA